MSETKTAAEEAMNAALLIGYVPKWRPLKKIRRLCTQLEIDLTTIRESISETMTFTARITARVNELEPDVIEFWTSKCYSPGYGEVQYFIKKAINGCRDHIEKSNAERIKVIENLKEATTCFKNVNDPKMVGASIISAYSHLTIAIDSCKTVKKMVCSVNQIHNSMEQINSRLLWLPWDIRKDLSKERAQKAEEVRLKQVKARRIAKNKKIIAEKIAARQATRQAVFDFVLWPWNKLVKGFFFWGKSDEN